MPLSYRGKPLIRILSLGNKFGGKPMYFVETSEMTCVVPDVAIGSDDGVVEVIRVANQSRGNMLEERKSNDCTIGNDDRDGHRPTQIG